VTPIRSVDSRAAAGHRPHLLDLRDPSARTLPGPPALPGAGGESNAWTMATYPPSMSGELVADLTDTYLPVYDVVITEHLVVEAGVPETFAAARDLDFMSVKSP